MKKTELHYRDVAALSAPEREYALVAVLEDGGREWRSPDFETAGSCACILLSGSGDEYFIETVAYGGYDSETLPLRHVLRVIDGSFWAEVRRA